MSNYTSEKYNLFVDVHKLLQSPIIVFLFRAFRMDKYIPIYPKYLFIVLYINTVYMGTKY
nr:MAG TPA: hypothetical protein [Caudoviricetes sp.]